MLKPKANNKELLGLTLTKLFNSFPDVEVNSKEEYIEELRKLAARPQHEVEAQVRKAVADAKRDLESCTYLY